MSDRRHTLQSLLRLDRPLNEVCAELARYPWDCPEYLVTLTRDDIRAVIARFGRGELGANEIYEWADTIEMREDIGYEEPYREEVLQAIYLMANPLPNGPLDPPMVAATLVSFSN